MSEIVINNLTKNYGSGKGIFDVTLSVKKGEVFGFLGPNGAGKTTTIRHLMGFINADKGSCTIGGLDCRTKSAEIQKTLGYLPGEIAFMDDMKGMDFIRFIAKMKDVADLTRANELMELLELNPQGLLKKMSKGMKQKIGLVCVFLSNPKVLLLDEPSSGLDPLMQNRFIELILAEKKKGTTIFLSSHIFEEIERTCDRTAIIRNGKLATITDMQTLRASKQKTYLITFETDEQATAFAKEGFKLSSVTSNTVAVSVKGDVMPLINAMNKYKITALDVKTQTLEELFLNFYGKGENGNA
ncbi:MAG: ABC transporter ATP-binding protein [Clostridiales bacterium GWF2_38_85]|nr:MAG: ABC transporter ATP-binding protein [Clostridiales bacterium GWF2_38_85]HBL84187.1 ABC transporter ATP-binding protein [Clostridiales bacterium]